MSSSTEFLWGIGSLALIQDGQVGNQAEDPEVFQYSVGAARDLSWRIDVINSDQPLAAGRFRLEEAGDRSNQRSKMQISRRRGRKAANAVSPGIILMHAAEFKCSLLRQHL